MSFLIQNPVKGHSEPSNWHIILTSYVCTATERMINAHLVWFLESNELLSDIQCGFREGRSTFGHLVVLKHFF